MTNSTELAFADTTERMRLIWIRILDHNEFGSTDSFFDVGGHSLLITELAIEIEKEFGVSIPAGAIFDHQTLSTLCTFINSPQ